MSMIAAMEFKHRIVRFARWPRLVCFLLVLSQTLVLTSFAAPKRLILAIDGVSYRDVKALQEGVTLTNHFGRTVQRQAFAGFFPVSRNVSTFPSVSDVAWTDILGDQPLPGYQRTYFDCNQNLQVALNGVASTMEYEQQMDWQMQSTFDRAQGYLFPGKVFKIEVRELIKSFLEAKGDGENFYGLIRATDDAQHVAGHIFPLMSELDEKLRELCATYKAREGRDLEILILSDHGNNHAGSGKRVQVRSFLKKAGYRIAKTIQGPKDVVLPTAGIESWVEIHNVSTETERLAALLCQLKGVEILTAQDPKQANRFIVMNAKGERAGIEWNSPKNSFRYATESGDPIGYLPVVVALAKNNQLDADGFATADAWMAATLTHHYPLAPERIVRGHLQAAQNPASILISLSNDYVHAGWLVKMASHLMKSGGTHGGLDDINSNGIVLSNFAPTQDTSTGRVAGLFEGFAGLQKERKNIATLDAKKAGHHVAGTQ